MDNRDSIDFGKEDIPHLFRKILIPTLLGMLCMSVMTITDGAFVGHGAGSDALAAINIFAPLWLVMTGLGLMFGIGCSVVASIHLAKGNNKAANINMTQAIGFGCIVSLVISLIVEIFDTQVARALGSSDRLLDLVLVYQKWLGFAFIPIFLQSVGLMLIRLDGSPKYAMFCSSIPAIINVVLDYILLFLCDMGLEGIAIATFTGSTLGGLGALFYLVFLSKNLHFYKLRMTKKSMMLTMRNIWYQVKLGFSAFLGEISSAMFMFVGNYVFMYYTGEDGVAAYSIACYLLPLIFMTGNAVAQSAQPIISYNYGQQSMDRVGEARKVSVKTSIILGAIVTFIVVVFDKYIVNLFLNLDCEAARFAVFGMPLMSIAFVPFLINLSMIGYFQSVERPKPATVFALLRGILLLVPCFIVMPILAGRAGLWLGMPVSEVLTMACVLVYYFRKK